VNCFHVGEVVVVKHVLTRSDRADVGLGHLSVSCSRTPPAGASTGEGFPRKTDTCLAGEDDMDVVRTRRTGCPKMLFCRSESTVRHASRQKGFAGSSRTNFRLLGQEKERYR
jgi:hypothetical protein